LTPAPRPNLLRLVPPSAPAEPEELTVEIERPEPPTLVGMPGGALPAGLDLVYPSGELHHVFLPYGDVKIGHSEHNEIVLPDDTVSATHAVIRTFGDRHYLVDFGSRNGVYVNGERITDPRVLSNGDVITVGLSTLAFHTGFGHETPVVEDDVKADEPEDDTPLKPGRKARARLRAAWISFVGRILAQVAGSAAAILLGLIMIGKAPSCSSLPGSDSMQNNAVSAPSSAPFDNHTKGAVLRLARTVEKFQVRTALQPSGADAKDSRDQSSRDSREKAERSGRAR